MSSKYSSPEEDPNNFDSNENDGFHSDDSDDKDISEERKYWQDMYEDEENEIRFREKKGKKKGKFKDKDTE